MCYSNGCVCADCDGIHENCPDLGCMCCPDSKDCPAKYLRQLEPELIGDISGFPPTQWDRATLKRHINRVV